MQTSTSSPSARPRWRRRTSLLAIGVAATLSLGTGIGTVSAANAATPKTVVVSLTFDDANADQVAAAQTLASVGLRGTFFINSGFLNAPGYLTNVQVQALAKAGNEIGGHTVNHPDLTAISAAEAQRQICQDRVNLSALGLSVTDFAYPFASENAAVESIVGRCGYNSARGLGDIQSRFGCAGCDSAETIPPVTALDTAALDEVESTWTLQDLENPITNAAKAGGWVQYTFHHICATAPCDDPQITSSLYGQFIQWLSAKVKAAGSTVQVKTVAQVINKAAKPIVAASYPVAAGPGVNAIKNPSLETVDPITGVPTAFMKGGYGANTSVFATSSVSHTGTGAEQLKVTGYSDGDAKLLPTLDLGDSAPTTVPGHTYSLREWYTSTGVTQFAVYTRSQSGQWTYWTSSPWFGAASSYAQAVWTTPATPAGVTGISFGLNLFSNATMVTDDWSMYDTVGAPALPVASATTRIAVAGPARAGAAGKALKTIKGVQRTGTIQVPTSAHKGSQG